MEKYRKELQRIYKRDGAAGRGPARLGPVGPLPERVGARRRGGFAVSPPVPYVPGGFSALIADSPRGEQGTIIRIRCEYERRS